jgi:hypothetical protein
VTYGVPMQAISMKVGGDGLRHRQFACREREKLT